MWDAFTTGFGPIRRLAQSLDPTRLEAFRRDIDSYHADYSTEPGCTCEYLATIGRGH